MQKIILFSSLVMGVSLGCSPPSDTLKHNETIKDRQNKYSSVGIERIIPLRFLNISDNNPPTENVSLDNINAAIDRANQVFRSAGIQFFLRSSEKYYTPNLIRAHVCCEDRTCSPACSTFSAPKYNWNQHVPGAGGPSNRTIGDDILGIFPSAQSPGTVNKRRIEWLDWASINYRDKSEIVVWVSPDPVGSFSSGPGDTQMVFMKDVSISGTVKFAHELGHFFAQPHTFSLPSAALNPETGTSATKEDWWDLIYGNQVGGSGSFKYFSSKQEAKNWTSSTVHPIDRGDNNCVQDGSGKVTCTVSPSPSSTYSEILAYNSSQLLEKTSFISNNIDNPSANPPSYKYGANVMGYLGLDYDIPSSFSPAQILMTRRVLRYDVQGSSNSQFQNQSSGRHLLGQYQSQSNGFRINFDGDSLRDFAVYEPPITSTDTGMFRILLSSRLYSSSSVNSVTISLGSLGDTPLIGDFNGDGIDDVSVWGRSTTDPSIAVWRWCISPSVPSSGQVPSCSNIQSVNFGTPSDIPLAGYRFSSASTGFFARYNPSTCTFTWRPANNFTAQSVAIGGVCLRSHMPLIGLYDDDDLADLVVYAPESAKFKIIRSSNGYQSSQMIESNFSANFIAGSSGSSYSRSGSVPVLGLYRSFQNQALGGIWTNRLALGLWQPWTGQLAINWDPINVSSASFYCSLGGDGSNIPFGDQKGQIVFGSMGTNFSSPSQGSACSQPAMFTSNKSTTGGTDLFTIANLPICNCSGSITSYQSLSHSVLQGGIRRVISPVSDMDGDGKADVLIYDYTSGSGTFLKSSTNFSTGFYMPTLGSARAVLL